jgi:hypothetical protein
MWCKIKLVHATSIDGLNQAEFILKIFGGKVVKRRCYEILHSGLVSPVSSLEMMAEESNWPLGILATNLENDSKTVICEDNSIKSLEASITLRIFPEGRGFVLPPTRIAPSSLNLAYCGLSILQLNSHLR